MKSIIICFVFMAVCIAVCLAVCRHWVQKACKESAKLLSDAISEERQLRLKAIRETLGFATSIVKEQEQSNTDSVRALELRIKDLENGVVPDFEQAKEAAQAVNDFNKGLSAIMGYDPFEVRKKAQEERGSRA